MRLIDVDGRKFVHLIANLDPRWKPMAEFDGDDFKELSGIFEAIERIPVADAAPVVHGQWLNFAGDFRTAECDKCGELYDVVDRVEPQEEYFDAFKQFYKYCPNCGAKMDA